MENRSTRSGRSTFSRWPDLVALMMLGLAAAPAAANINLEMRPALQTVFMGPNAEVEIGLYAVSDDQTNQTFMVIEAIIAWETEYVQLIGLAAADDPPLILSGFPTSDPSGLNESNPPQDGDGLYIAWAFPGNPIPATPGGTLIRTFLFEPVAPTPATPIDILETAGDPPTDTLVYHGTIPNLDVVGTLSGCTVEIMPCCPADFNYDCVVNVLDFLILLSAWGTDPGGPPDLNGNGAVDVNDFLLLLAAWGPCP